MEEKITINKSELLMMMNEYWAIDNNDICSEATALFMKRHNFTEYDVEHHLDRFDFEGEISKELEEEYLEQIENFK